MRRSRPTSFPTSAAIRRTAASPCRSHSSCGTPRSVHTFKVNVTHSTVQSSKRSRTLRTWRDWPHSVSERGVCRSAELGCSEPDFSGLTGVRGASASQRTDRRLTLGYAWLHPVNRHRLRIGGDVRLDASDSQINSNARGSFTFTGLYSSGGVPVLGATGADFADFLLGFAATGLAAGRRHQPSASSTHSTCLSRTTGRRAPSSRSVSAFATSWRCRMSRSTDAWPISTSRRVSRRSLPFCRVAYGPSTGAFPAGLLNTDANNLGPRLGFAYRVQPATIVRGGYSITYNSGSYASIARRTRQPAAVCRH